VHERVRQRASAGIDLAPNKISRQAFGPLGLHWRDQGQSQTGLVGPTKARQQRSTCTREIETADGSNQGAWVVLGYRSASKARRLGAATSSSLLADPQTLVFPPAWWLSVAKT
jgi:hypothetical protein